MSLIAVRARLRERRKRRALLALLLVLAGVIAVHHGVPAIGDAHDGSHLAAAAELCLGVFTAGAAAAAAGVARTAPAYTQPAPLILPSGALPTAGHVLASARAGPDPLVLLCVSRR